MSRTAPAQTPGRATPDAQCFDERQKAAELRQCVACLRWYYMSHPQPVCVECRR